jgi:hypothetical protein
MPISTRWYDDERHAIVHKFEGAWTWEELVPAQAQVMTLAESVPYKLVMLVDMAETNILPRGNVLAQGKMSLAHLPENISIIVIVIQSRLLEVFASLVFDMLPSWRNRVRFAKNLKEGQQLVAEAVAKNSVGS